MKFQFIKAYDGHTAAAYIYEKDGTVTQLRQSDDIFKFDPTLQSETLTDISGGLIIRRTFTVVPNGTNSGKVQFKSTSNLCMIYQGKGQSLVPLFSAEGEHIAGVGYLSNSTISGSYPEPFGLVIGCRITPDYIPASNSSLVTIGNSVHTIANNYFPILRSGNRILALKISTDITDLNAATYHSKEYEWVTDDFWSTLDGATLSKEEAYAICYSTDSSGALIDSPVSQIAYDMATNVLPKQINEIENTSNEAMQIAQNSQSVVDNLNIENLISI